MKLKSDELKRITFGAASIDENHDTFSFHRFTREQTELYSKHKLDMLQKTFSTAGIRFSFYTNATAIHFDYRMAIASSRTFGWFDVYEDGILTAHFGGEAKLLTSGHADISFTPGEKRVEIYFPWSKATQLSNIELDGELISPCIRSRTMLLYGDSITHGYDAIYPSLSYSSLLSKELDADSINKGIGGEVFFPELAELKDPIDPDIVTVAYGTNDWSLLTRSTFEADCLKFYSNICRLYPRSKIFAITPIWRADNTHETKFGAPHTTLYSLMSELLKPLPVIPINGYQLTPHNADFYSDKYLHPNDLGFSIYAKELTRQIKKHL